MSDHVKRFVCRALFVFGCLLPTVVVLNWVLRPSTPQQWQNAIKQQFGLSTTIGAVETPLPQQTILQDVLLHCAEQQETTSLGSISIVNTEQNRQVWVESLSISNQSLSHLLQRIYREVRDIETAARPLKIHFGSVTIIDEQQHLKLSNVVVQVTPKTNSLEITLNFQLPSAADGDWITMGYERRQEQTTTEIWTLDTRQNKLPTLLLAESISAAKSLGDSATFQGVAHVRVIDSRVDADIWGRIDQINLFELVFEPFDRFLSGTASVQLNTCRMSANKLTLMEGTFECKAGRIEKELLLDLVEGMPLPAPQLRPAVQDQPYIDFSHAQFAFRIKSGLLALQGDEKGNLFESSDIEGTGLVVSHQYGYPIERLLQALGTSHQPALPRNVAELAKYLQLYADVAQNAEASNSVGEPVETLNR